jgi:hypothetical protein
VSTVGWNVLGLQPVDDSFQERKVLSIMVLFTCVFILSCIYLSMKFVSIICMFVGCYCA